MHSADICGLLSTGGEAQLPVGHEGRSTSQTEEGRRQQEGAVSAAVVVEGDVLMIHDQAGCVGHRLHVAISLHIVHADEQHRSKGQQNPDPLLRVTGCQSLFSSLGLSGPPIQQLEAGQSHLSKFIQKTASALPVL